MAMDKETIYVTRSSMPPYDEYIEAIKPLWESRWLTNMGEYHKELEERLKNYLEVPGLSLMVNGHMSLEMTIQAFDFPEGSEVITTPFTFVSTTHAIVRNRLSPVFCDIKECDGTIDESKIEELITPKTVAILPVHVYGHVCNVAKIKDIADKYNLRVIYDAAHAFGVKYEDCGIGCFGDASIFSFHATKLFHTVEGGAVAFSDKSLYEKLYNLKNFGIHSPELVKAVGANAKMNELSAIMGLCNLKRIDEVLDNRKEKFEYYKRKLDSISGIEILEGNPEATNNYAYMPIRVLKEYGKTRDELYDIFEINGIKTRKYFYPITADQVCFKNKYRDVDLRNARMLAGQVLVLPLYEEIRFDQIDKIIDVISTQ